MQDGAVVQLLLAVGMRQLLLLHIAVLLGLAVRAVHQNLVFEPIFARPVLLELAGISAQKLLYVEFALATILKLKLFLL